MINIKSKFTTLSTIEIKLVVALFAIILGTLGFILIAFLVTRGSTDYFDMRVLRSLRNCSDLTRPRGPEWLFEFMKDITSLGGSTVVFLITFFVIGYYILQKRYSMMLLALVAVIGGALIDLELKEIFSRVRPQIFSGFILEKSFGFPSGHSMMATIIYLSLAALIARLQVRRRDKIYIISVAVFLSFMIGISRIYLGVHYPTDVIGGWSLGLAWAAFCWFVAWYISNKRSIKSGNDLPDD
jgi:undecaprenyl-diphosphatase